MLRLFMIVLWPSFLVAIVGEGLLFSLIDPFHSTLADNKEVLSPIAAYTIGFFLLWGVCALSSTLTWYLSGTPKKNNERNGG